MSHFELCVIFFGKLLTKTPGKGIQVPIPPLIKEMKNLWEFLFTTMFSSKYRCFKKSSVKTGVFFPFFRSRTRRASRSLACWRAAAPDRTPRRSGWPGGRRSWRRPWGGPGPGLGESEEDFPHKRIRCTFLCMIDLILHENGNFSPREQWAAIQRMNLYTNRAGQFCV